MASLNMANGLMYFLLDTADQIVIPAAPGNPAAPMAMNFRPLTLDANDWSKREDVRIGAPKYTKHLRTVDNISSAPGTFVVGA
jgi:hypothetical protein